MSHVIEPAPTGRARCRGCEQPIAKSELRFGERLPNAFGEGEMTLWFHLRCAAYKRPAPLLETLRADPAVRHALDAAGARGGEAAPPTFAELESAAERGIAHRRLPRVNGAEQAPTGRARCRACHEAIAKDTWRIPLVYFEEYRFAPSGFVHAACAREYLGTVDLLDRARHFNPSLTDTQLAALAGALEA